MNMFRSLIIMVLMTIYGLASAMPAMPRESLDGVPSQINIGDFAIVSMIAEVTTIIVECSAPSAFETFKVRADVSGFNGTTELMNKIREMRVRFKIKNPTDFVNVSATLLDKFGRELFSSNNGFYLEKVYDKEGNISYRPPSWAVDLYFVPANIEVKFRSAVFAELVKNGNRFSVPVVDGKIFLPGWSLYGGGYEYLSVSTRDGVEYLFNARTGQRLNPESLSLKTETVWVSGIQRVAPEEGFLSLGLQPEYGYTPWIETSFSDSGQMGLDVQSVWEVEPIAVWITRLEDLRAGVSPEVISYYNGMVLEGQGTVFLWFEFPGWLYGTLGGSKG